MVLMDNSASMSDSFAPQRLCGGGEAAQAATKSLFLAFKHKSSICRADDTAAAISRLFPAGSACPANIRLHSHKETGAFKGSCHLNFTSVADASSALHHLKERHWYPHGPVNKAEYAEAPVRPSGGHGKAPRSDTRFTMAQMALHFFADRSQELDLPHAAGLLLVGTHVSTTCKLTASLQAFQTTVERAQEERAAERGGHTCLLAGLREAAQQLYSFQDAHKGCKLRILAITDGEDTSGDNPLKELETLRTMRCTVDVVVLGGARAGDLAAIAEFTRGLVVQPMNEDDLASIFQAETLMQVGKRKRKQLPGMPNDHSFKHTSRDLGFSLSNHRRQYREAQTNLLQARGLLTDAAAAADGGGARQSNVSASAVIAVADTTSALSKPVVAPTGEHLDKLESHAMANAYMATRYNAADSSRPSLSRIKRLMSEMKKCAIKEDAHRELHTQLEVYIGVNFYVL